MIRVEKCPICECKNLRCLKQYQFILPETKEYDDSIGDVTYTYERLWIFFNKIWRDRKPAEFNVTLCTSCGMIFTNPRFSAEEILVKYSTVSELGSAQKRTQMQPALKTDERAKRIYQLLTGLQENRSHTVKVLDYGGAEGYNLLYHIEAGNLCYLIDYVKSDYPKSIEYLGRDISDLPCNELFDVILLCHTLEHTTDPRHMIEALSSHLTEGGLLYVEVPLGCWNEWKKLKEPLTHVNFFSEESLYKCVRSADLDIIYLSSDFQWVTHAKLWCINIVGCKRKGTTVRRFKTTRRQKENPSYYLEPFMENPRYYLKRLANKIKERVPRV